MNEIIAYVVELDFIITYILYRNKVEFAGVVFRHI